MVDLGFVKAKSDNLPRLDMFMVTEFLKADDCFSGPELRGAKAAMASRESYGDNAVGYVQLKREGQQCCVKAKICPEHKVRSSMYLVSLTIDEDEEKVLEIACHSCAAAAGGCKHALAFLMWLHRRSEDPAPTEVACYWKKSTLSRVGTSIKFIEAKALGKQKDETDLPDNSTILNDFLLLSENKQLESQISRHNFTVEKNKLNILSIYQQMLEFCQKGDTSVEDFLSFCEGNMSEELCIEAEISTRGQSNEVLWFELRYGRVTASKVYEAAHCKTSEGSLVNQLVGASKIKDTKAMERGRRLEGEVIRVMEEKLQIKFNKCGFYILLNKPIFGASPDAITENFVVEVKCPTSDKSLKQYIKNGVVTPKYLAQIQLQMFAAKKNKGLFCVADANFEENKKVYEVWIDFDTNLCNDLLKKATIFWNKNIFKKIFESACK